MQDSEEILSALDQPLIFDPTPYIESVDDFYTYALKGENAIFVIVSKVKELSANITLTGLALSRLLYRISTDWEKFGINDTFEDFIYAYVGKSRTTVDRYIKVWKMYENGVIPDEYKSSIQALPLRSQVPIALALEQGHAIKQEQWEKLVNAPDNTTLRSELREIKNQPMRKTGLMFILHRNGDLTATDSNGKSHFIGYLKVDDPDEIVQRCINRIVDNSYISRQ